VLYGEKLETENLWQMGYVNWQAFLGLISTSILFAPVGAKWAEKLPMKLLEKLFSLVLMAVSASLFFG
jgi:uncharacterized membrane protein YfcA